MATVDPVTQAKRDADHAKLVAANYASHGLTPPSKPITNVGVPTKTGLTHATPVAPAPAAPAPAPAAPVAHSGDAFTDSTGVSLANSGAYDYAKSVLASWGLSSLAGSLDGLLKNGVSTSDELTLALQDTDAYKQRFAGNAARIKNGYAALTPAQYVATEDQYHQIMQSAGLPSNFYDEHSDFAGFIANGISPTEMQARVQVATNTWTTADANTKAAWNQYYGLDDGHAIAGILDPATALPILQQRAAAAQLGGAAADAGVSGVTKDRAEKFAQFGTTLQQAQSAFANVKQYSDQQSAIGQRFGLDTGATTMENAALLGDGSAAAALNLANTEEEAGFSGHGGADAQSMAVSNNY